MSAFYVSCPQKQISLTGSVWTKSKFMGMSIGVTMIGGLTLSLPEHNEVLLRFSSLPFYSCRFLFCICHNVHIRGPNINIFFNFIQRNPCLNNRYCTKTLMIIINSCSRTMWWHYLAPMHALFSHIRGWRWEINVQSSVKSLDILRL